MIEKTDSARLIKEQVPYDIVSRAVVQSIRNPVALAIYTYLMTKPDNWVVRRSEILNHFQGLGRDRYDAAVKELTQLGLYWVNIQRDGNGRIVDRQVVVEALPKDHLRSDFPQVGKTTMRENPPLKDTEIVKETKNNKYDHFDRFWKTYPKKVGKQDARKAWGNLPKGIRLNIISHIESRVWSKDKQFIPNPATFIRGKRWEDEVCEKDSHQEVSYL